MWIIRRTGIWSRSFGNLVEDYAMGGGSSSLQTRKGVGIVADGLQQGLVVLDAYCANRTTPLFRQVHSCCGCGWRWLVTSYRAGHTTRRGRGTLDIYWGLFVWCLVILGGCSPLRGGKLVRVLHQTLSHVCNTDSNTGGDISCM